MKTPDEIKKYLANCDDKSECSACYSEWRCKREADALAYIQQLEAELEAVKRERNAAVHDLSKARDCCHFCKHDAVYTSVCDECHAGSNFKWRGVQETEV